MLLDLIPNWNRLMFAHVGWGCSVIDGWPNRVDNIPFGDIPISSVIVHAWLTLLGIFVALAEVIIRILLVIESSQTHSMPAMWFANVLDQWVWICSEPHLHASASFGEVSRSNSLVDLLLVDARVPLALPISWTFLSEQKRTVSVWSLGRGHQRMRRCVVQLGFLCRRKVLPLTHFAVFLHLDEGKGRLVDALLESKNTRRLKELWFAIGTRRKDSVVLRLLEVDLAGVHSADSLQVLQDLDLIMVKLIHWPKSTCASSWSAADGSHTSLILGERNHGARTTSFSTLTLIRMLSESPESHTIIPKI